MSFQPEDKTRYLCKVTGHGVEEAENSKAVYLWLTFDVLHEAGAEPSDVEYQGGSTRIYLLNRDGAASDKHRKATMNQLQHLGFDGPITGLEDWDFVGQEFEATAKYNDRGYVDWDFRGKRTPNPIDGDAALRLQAIYG